jgi:hypothetical protein
MFCVHWTKPLADASPVEIRLTHYQQLCCREIFPTVTTRRVSVSASMAD